MLERSLRAYHNRAIETAQVIEELLELATESVRARLRSYVKRILRKYGYPPDKAEKATRTVLEQAELLSEAWAA